jgi:tRNA-dihydrouridine synthase
MRAQMHHYMKGLPNAALFRRRINSVDSLQELSDLTLAYAADVRSALAGEGSP